MEMGLSGDSGPRVTLSGTYQNPRLSSPIDLYPGFSPWARSSPIALPWGREPFLASPKCCCGALGASSPCSSQMSLAGGGREQ